jgi:hypothetical protein
VDSKRSSRMPQWTSLETASLPKIVRYPAKCCPGLANQDGMKIFQ